MLNQTATIWDEEFHLPGNTFLGMKRIGIRKLEHLCAIDEGRMRMTDFKNYSAASSSHFKNYSAARMNRLDRLMFRTDERLPGAVLQAQARVLET